MQKTDIKQNNFIKQVKLHKNDCGSTFVQIASLSYKINSLTNHLRKFKKDNHSKVGLVKKVNERRCLLKYIKKKNEIQYMSIIKHFNIKK